MIILICGPDRLLARQATERLVADLDPHGQSTSWLDARETAPEQLRSAVGTVPLFGGASVVVVSNFLGRSGNDATPDGTPERHRASRREQSGLPDLIATVPEAHTLVFFEPDLGAAPAAFKAAVPSATIIISEPPRGAALIAWITETAHRSGASIDRRAAQLLAETLYPQTWSRQPANVRFDRPPDLALLSQEIERLALDAHPGPITPELVGASTPGRPDQRLFRFLDAVLGGDLRTAVAELARLEAAGEEPAMLLAQLLGQVEISTVAQAAGGHDANSVAKDLGSISATRIAAVMSAARRRTVADEAAAISLLADRRLKTGRTRRPAAALHDLVAALADR